MPRIPQGPNQQGLIEWQEKVVDPGGDFITVSLELETVETGEGLTEVQKDFSEISWLDYDITSNILSDGTRETIVNIAVDSDSISEGKVYHFKGLASDSQDQADRTFTLTVNAALFISTKGVNTVGSNSVSMAGSLDDKGEASDVDVFFEYRKNGDSNWKTSALKRVDNPGSYNITIPGLRAETDYEVRAKAVGTNGQTDTGSISTINTGQEVSVETIESKNVLGNSAELVGDLKSIASSPAVDVFFEYRKQIFNTATLNRSNDLSSEDTSITGLYLRSDGKKAYVSGSGSDSVYEYNLSSPWDISTASFANEKDVSNEDSAPTGVFLGSGGSRMYVAGSENGKIYEYTLSSDWNITSASVVRDFEIGFANANPTDLFIHPDGIKLYITESSNDNIFEYELSTPWDISTSSLINTFDISGQDQSPRGITINSTGRKLYMVGDVNDKVFEYDLPDEFDTSSALFNKSFDISGTDDSPRSVRFHVENTSMYIVGRTNNSIFEYSIDGNYKTTDEQRLTSTGVFSESLSGLSNDTNYEFRARADAIAGDSDIGQNLKFTTQEAVDVVNNSVENLDTTSLTLSADLKNLGGASSADVYFEYREEGNSTWNSTPVQTLNSPETFKEGISGLTTDTSYEFRAVAEASDGEGDTAEIDLVTTDTIFQVSTQNVTEIDTNSATFNGVLDDLGGADNASVNFEYRETGASSWNSTTQQTFITAPTEFSQTISGLTSNVEYEVRVVGNASDGDSDTGSTLTFTTTTSAAVSTDSVNVSGNDATFDGTLLDIGGADEVFLFFEYRRSGTTNWDRTNSERVTASTSYSQTATKLSGSTDYEVRARVSTSDGDNATGSILTFTTGSGLAVRSGSIQDVDTDNITVEGNLDSLGGASEADVLYQTRTFYTNEYGGRFPTSWEDSTRETLTSTGSFSINITGLNPTTFYQVRAFAIASDGDEAAGSVLSTTTDPLLQGETLGVTFIGSNSATLEGELNNLGGASSTDALFEFRKVGESSWNTSSSQILNSPSTYTQSISGLTSGDEYEFRAVINADDGDSVNGSVLTFTPRPVGILAKEATNVTNDSATLNAELTDKGGADSVDVTFEYRESGTSTWQNGGTKTLNSTGDVSVNISGLTVDVTYEFRVLANSSDGDSATSDSILTFTTKLINTESPSEIDTNSVTFNSILHSLEGASSGDIYFEYRETGASSWNSTQTETVTSTGTFSQNVSGLNVNTQYEYRVQLETSDGTTVTGEAVQFTTDTLLDVSTDPTSNVGDSFAIFNGTLNDLGGASNAEAFFEFRKTGSTVWSSSPKTTLNSTGTYQIRADGLEPNSEYEARARVDASDGDTTTGSNITFITDIELVVTTDSIGSIRQDSAVFTGSLDDLGEASSVDVSFEFRRTGWNVSRGSFLNAFNVGSQEADPQGLFFKPDGKKLFVVGFENDNVYEYNLGSAWDITTSSFSAKLDVFSEDGSPRDIFFGLNGTKMYMLGGQNIELFEYDLDSAWDITTASLNQSQSISNQDSNPEGLFVRSDGKKVYTCGVENGNVYEYNFGSDWDITSITFNQSFDVSNQDPSPKGIEFRDNGTRMFIVGGDNSEVYEYVLSNSWNVSTSTFDQLIDISNEDTNPTGIRFRESGLDFYVTGDIGENVYRYELPKSYSTTPSQNLTSIGSYTETGTGMQSSSEYSVRARADADDGDISFGSSLIYNTQKTVDVQTDPVSTFDENSATFEGQLNHLGGASSADVYFEYKISGNENWNNQTATQTLNSTGTFSINETGLSSSTSYQVRAVAVSSDGDEGRGGSESFQTNASFVVNTTSVTNIDENNSDLEGDLVDLGGATDADVFFEYRETGASSWNTTSTQNLTSTGQFTIQVSGLTAGVEYEFRAVGNAADGDTSTGNTITFNAGLPPIVSTDTPTEVDTTSMTLNGTLDDLGGASSADVFFEYRYSEETESGSEFTDWISTSRQTFSSAGSVHFEETISGLNIDTTHQIRTVAEASDGNTGRGSTINQKTDTELVGSTQEPTSVGIKTATLEGNVEDFGGASSVDVYFEYRKVGTGTWSTTSTQTLNSTGAFNANLTGLDVDADYEFRAIINAADGDSIQGSILTFLTNVVSTGQISNKDTGSVTLNGTLDKTDGYSSVQVYFQYRQTGESTWNSTAIQVLNQAGSYSQDIFSLIPGTQYEFRAFAELSDGNQADGSIENFTTHELVTVQTEQPSEIDDTSLTLNGTLSELGGAESGNVFFEYREVGNSIWNITEKSTKNSTGSFSFSLTELNSNTDYEYRAGVNASDGDSDKGDIVSFSTIQSVQISTDGSQNVEESSVTFNGTLNNLGGAESVDVSFEYRKTGTSEYSESSTQTLNSTGSFSINISNLDPDTEYEFRASAIASDEDTAKGSVLTFITDPLVSITTESVTNLGTTSATLRSNVGDLGDASSADVSFEWRQVGNSTWNTTATQSISSTGPVNDDISGLTENAQYEYRALITASDGDTDMGQTLTFIANPDPSVVTDNATNIGGSNVTLNGTLERRGGALSATVFFEYRTTGSSTWNTSATQTITSEGSYSQVVSGLQSQTDYEFRAVADLSDGDSSTGVAVTFSSGQPPAISTESPSNIRGSSVTLNGNISSLGSATKVDAFFEYREVGASTWNESVRQERTSTGLYSANVKNLDPSTDYEFRAKGIADTGDIETGAITSVTTDDAVSVITDSFDESSDNATFFGILQDLGGAQSADVFFEYRKTGNQNWISTQIQTVNAIGSFERTVTGLESETEYEFRAVVEASDDDTDKDVIISFVTDPFIVLTTGTAENVEVTSATLNGSVDNFGGADSVEAFFEYREVGALTWNSTSSQTLQISDSITQNVTGLNSNTQYEYRIALTASDGDTASGDIQNFSTDPVVSVSTDNPSDITFQSFTLNGTIESLGGASDADVFFEWRKVGNTTWNQTSTQNFSSATTFSENISGLDADTEYEFRTQINASDGDSDTGDIKSERTDAEAQIEITTSGSSNIGTTSATLNGSLDDLGEFSSLDVNFQYRPVGSSSWTESSVQTLNSTGSYSESVSNLDEDTEYEFRAKAEGPVTGDILTFTTDPFFTITTNQPSQVVSIFSILEGSLNELNINEVDLNFEWRKSGESNWNDTPIETFTSTGDFDKKVGGFPNLNFESSSLIGGRVRLLYGINFSTDGSVMVLADERDDKVVQYSLSSSFDITTASETEKTLSIQNSNLTDVLFGPNGNKLFVVTRSNDVEEYTLSTSYDISTATHVTTFSTGNETNNATDLKFNDDGTKLFVSDRGNESVYSYNLNTAYDISTASFSGNSFSVDSEVNGFSGFVFNSDGTRMIVSERGNGVYYQYDLTNSFDLTSASYTGTSFNISQDARVEGFATNGDGTKFFAAGANSGAVFEHETGGSSYEISNLTFTNNSLSVDDPASQIADMTFGKGGERLYVLSREITEVYEYSLSSAYDLTTLSLTGNSYDIGSDLDTGNARNLQDIEFSEDGSKMFIMEEVGNRYDTDRLHQFNLSTDWDITTTSWKDKVSVNSKESGLTFAKNGKKIYTVSTRFDQVTEYDIDSQDPYDLTGTSTSSGINFTNTLDLTQFTSASPEDIIFLETGFTFFIYTSNHEIQEFELSDPFDTNSTVSYTERSFNHRDQNSVGSLGIESGPDFNQIFVVDSDRITFKYNTINLQGTTQYEYRAVGTGNNKTKEGSIVEFTTKKEISVSTDSPTNIKVFEANFNGVVNQTGTNLDIDTFFEYKTDNISTAFTPVEKKGEGNVSFSDFGTINTLSEGVKTIDLSSEMSNVGAYVIDPSGKRLIVSDNNSQAFSLFQYDLTVPFDLSTATLNSSVDISVFDRMDDIYNLERGRIRKNGTEFYISTNGGSIRKDDYIYQFTFSNPYDINSIEDNKFNQFGNSDAIPFRGEFDISEDGTLVFYIRDNDPDSFDTDFEFFSEDLSTPFDITSAGGRTNYGNKPAGNKRSPFKFSPDGTIFYTLGNGGLQKWSLSTPFDINSNRNLEIQSSRPTSMISNEEKTIWLSNINNGLEVHYTGLANDTQYEYKFNGRNKIQTDEGGFVRFTTEKLPLISTLDTNVLNDTDATFNANIDDLAGSSEAEVSFEYREAGSNTWNETTKETVSSTGSFSQTITSLTQDTSYAVRAKIDTGTSTFGKIDTFKTQKDFVIDTDPATSVSLQSATLEGSMDALNVASSADLFFEYRKTGSSTWQTTATETVSSTGSFSKSVSSLDNNAEYQFRLVGTASSLTERGEIYTFYTENSWLDGFESGLDAWNITDNTFEIKTNRVYDGSQSAGVESSPETIVAEKSISASQPDSVEWFWQETSNQSGSALHFINSNGDLEVALGSDNPQWDIFYENSSNTVLGRSSTYDRWIRFKVIFDWVNSEFDYEMEDMQDGTTASGTANLAYGIDVDKIGLGSKPGTTSASDNWWDNILVDKGDPIFQVSTGDGSVTNSTATLNGSLDYFQLSGDATVFFEWRKVGDSSWNKTPDQTLSNPGSFSDSFSINTDNEYEFRAVAESNGITTTGSTKVFSRNIVGTVPDGLWTMDDRDISNDILTEPINGYNAHDVSNVTTGVTGQVNEAFSFDGSNSNYLPIEKLKFDSNNAIDQISLVTWVKFENNENGGTVLGFDGSEYFRFNIDPNSVSADNAGFNYSFATAIDDGTWHHVAYVFDSSASGYDTRLYLDGTKVEETTARGGSAFGSGSTRFGFFGDDSEATTFDGQRNTIGFEGDLDDFRYYETPLTNTEVQEIYGGQLDSFTMETRDATNVDSSSATLNGFVGLADKEDADVVFEWRKEGNTDWNVSSVQTLTTSQSYSASISGLTENEIYEFRARGIDNTGQEEVGSINTFLAISPFTEGFESDLSAWTVNESRFSTTTSPVFAGSQSAGMEDDLTISNVDLIERSLLGSKPTSASWFWWETSSQTGSAFIFYNSNGNYELALGTENPQWTVWDGDGSSEIYNGDGTQRWINYQVTSFNWDNGTYDYYMEDTSSGTTRTGTRNLKHGVDIVKISIGTPPFNRNSHHCYWDEITIDLN